MRCICKKRKFYSNIEKICKLFFSHSFIVMPNTCSSGECVIKVSCRKGNRVMRSERIIITTTTCLLDGDKCKELKK